MPLFSAVWQQFLALPSVTAVSAAASDPVLEGWRRGRERYWIWALTVDEEPLRGYWQQCRQQLAAWLLPDYGRQPHITLAVAGFPLCGAAPGSNDSFTSAQLAACEARLQSARVEPFELQLGGVNSFAAAPFLEVIDPQGQLHRLRQALLLHGDDFCEQPWCPHLTLGYYRSASAPALLRPALEQCSGAGAPTLWVRQVSLLSYRASDVCGALTVERHYPLAG